MRDINCQNKNNGKQKNKTLFIILKVLLSIIIVVIVLIAIIASKNVKAMNSCIDATLAELQQNYTVTPLDVGEYKELKMYGIMKFHVEQYDIEELGNLSIMRVNMGIMQMATVVITPKEKNMPLLSADYIYILTNRKAYLEFYDVVSQIDNSYQQLLDHLSTIQSNYQYLENLEVSPAWYEHLLTVATYKSGTVKHDTDLENMLLDSLKVYLEHAKQLPALNNAERTEKKAITLDYTDGLIEKGGISTDVFKKELGNEETKKFFDYVFFGTAVN